MDFKLSEVQTMLKEQARSFFDKELSKETQRAILHSEKGYSPEMWRKMASLGWQSLLFPEKYGGTGGNFSDVAILLEEIGRALLPSPFFSSVVLSGLVILEGGTEKQKIDLLPGIASGDSIFTLALTGTSGEYDAGAIGTTAAVEANGYRLDGVSLYVPDAAAADSLICLAKTNDKVSHRNGITIFIVDARSPRINYTELKTIARDKQYEVAFDKVFVPDTSVIRGLNNGWGLMEKVLPRIYIAQCAMMLGGTSRVLDMTVNHIKETSQGGRLLGTMQALQHMCADIEIDLEVSRFLTYEAAWKVDRGLPFAMEASMAKAWVSSAYWRTSISGQQIHAGVGYVEDPDMGLITRKAKALEVTFGDTEFHREKIAQMLGL